MIIKVRKYLFQLKLVFTVVIVANLSSCSSHQESSQASGEVSLIPKDSIKIDVLSPIKIYDYDSENNLFLLGDVADGFSELLPPKVMPKGNEIGFIIVDGAGEVLGQFNNTGDGPVNHGIGAKNNLFLDDNRIGVFTQIGFFVYDFDGNLLGRSKALNTQRTYLDIPFDISAYQNGNLALGYTTMSMKAWQNQDNPYPFMKSFRVFDLNGLLGSDDGINEHTIQNYGFPEGIADETIDGTSPRMAFNKRTGVLSVLFSKFQKLHQYSIADGSFLNVIDLKPAYFSSGNEPIAAAGNAGKLTNSAYHDMVQLGDYTLIRYSSAISNTQAGQLMNSGGLSESEYWETLRKSTYKFYYLLIKDGSVVKQDFELEALSPQLGEEYFRSTSDLRGQLIGGSDLNALYVLYNNDYAQERDYKLIVRYKLKLD